ncbi:hypothetical protein BDQ94DRAFT_143455 [Aspergillus welwitschiae]|uniref:Uncharacterized protein n=1 Tax=Aspergillus welwitschiae TaxID=1341132 RepID=A0A3F3Q4J8_9EURO|nr:hypothetical protein BDQ94DRAFT_143455 [Aspergillus welwitschiae]RDH33626.1 hypothetical protein BDQ94DRAFT_143455 [Aspergillus welwitschiae]
MPQPAAITNAMLPHERAFPPIHHGSLCSLIILVLAFPWLAIATLAWSSAPLNAVRNLCGTGIDTGPGTSSSVWVNASPQV